MRKRKKNQHHPPINLPGLLVTHAQKRFMELSVDLLYFSPKTLYIALCMAIYSMSEFPCNCKLQAELHQGPRSGFVHHYFSSTGFGG